MKALIVDDNSHWRKLLGAELTYLGFECSFAKNDTEAIDAVRKSKQLGNPFKLITIDREMDATGDLAGRRVLSFLKDDLELQRGETVCVVISGTASGSDVRDYFKQYGVRDFFTKDGKVWDGIKQLAKQLKVGSASYAAQRNEQVHTEQTQEVSTPTEELVKLHRKLTRHFDDEELHTLCFQLDVDYDDLRGTGKAGKARELVAYLERKGLVPELVKKCSELRPRVRW